MRKIMEPVLPKLIEEVFYLDDEETIQGILSTDIDQSNGLAKNVIVKNSRFKKLTMCKTTLERFECSDVIFENCDLSNLDCFGGSFHRVIFKQCKLIGSNFAESFFRDCQFEESVIKMASFSSTNLKSVRFTQCNLEDTDFYGVKWKNLFLEQNDLTGTNWHKTSMKDLNFSSNQFTKIGLSLDLLEGLIVNQEQALAILSGLGLVVEE